MPLLPGAEPFEHDGGPVGALVLHGFAGSPAGVRPLALDLADHDLTVLVPRLPGHGTTWQDLAVCRWDDFHAEADRALSALRERCSEVVVAGQGVGGALALRLAELRPADVAGLVLVNPALELHRPSRAASVLLPLASLPAGPDARRGGGYERIPLRTYRSVAHEGWDAVRADIGRVEAPVLVVRSTEDRVVPPSSAEWLRAHLVTPDVTELVLEGAGHLVALDPAAREAFAACVDFVHRVAPSSADA
jgi:carboxylesterase